MEYSLTVNGEQKKMAITSPPSAPSALEDKEAVIGEQIYKFRATVIDDHKLLLSINGSQVAAYLARVGKETQVFINGELYSILDLGEADKNPQRRGGPHDQLQKITPPMPAVVIRLLVALGDAVKKGQPLIVLSAMKMEATLYAPYAGTVKKINAAAGEQVMPGLILVEIEQALEE